jgi:DNA-binding PadR family transcriptional regulator
MPTPNQQSSADAAEPLTPAVLHVLLAMQAGAVHGYAIMRAVEQTAGLVMGPGTIYGTLQRLEGAGLMEETVAPPSASSQRRRYYRLTAEGEAGLRREAARIASLAELLRTRGLVPSARTGG